MLAGMLHQAGYFMGDKFHLPRDSNPKGFFEWHKINRINENILAKHMKSSFTAKVLKKVFKKNVVENPGENQRWLAYLPLDTNVKDTDVQLEKEIRAVVRREPFCYKDPRFSYTLPVWRRHLGPGMVFICIFREPDVTVASILKECRDQAYLADLHISRESAYRVWGSLYSHILFKHDRADGPGDFFFVHYDQIVDGTAVPALSLFLDSELKSDFVDKNLQRSIAIGKVPGQAKAIYEQLCRRANYRCRDSQS
jgi:hypothetical protein